MSEQSSTLFLRLPPLGSPPPPEAPPRARAALLERVLCRADERAGGPDWRRDAFHRIAANGEPYPQVAPAALYAALGAGAASAASAVYLATAVHYRPTMTSVQLADDGILALDADEARRLALDFNRVFDGGPRLLAAPSGTLFCAFDQALAADTRDPLEVAGGDIGRFQAEGTDARRLRALASEIEMWLFDHPVNRARAARRLASIDGLWLWGGGVPLARAPRLAGWAGGADPLFSALDQRAGVGSEGASGVVCAEATPGSAAWAQVEQRWLAPALAALAARRLVAIEVSAGLRVFRFGARERLRFWRRRHPWWERLV